MASTIPGAIHVLPAASDYRSLLIGRYLLSVNDKSAVPWLEAAAEGGEESAFIMLGHAYMAGIFGFKDELAAMQYYEKAARMGSVRGQYLFGTALETHDSKFALQYLKAAATGGSIEAAHRLATPPESLAGRLSNIEVYYWSLVFRYLSEKKPDDANWEDGLEQFEYYELPGSGSKRSETLITRSFSGGDAMILEMKERSLSGSERIAVQKLVEKWVASFEGNSKGTNSQRKYDSLLKRQEISKYNHGWGREALAICAGDINSIQIGAEHIYNSVRKSIWTVVSGNPKSANSTYGTAIAVSDHHLLTNCHVLTDENEIRISSSGVTKNASIVESRPEIDICLIRTVVKNDSYIAHSRFVTDLKIGESSYSIGNPVSFESTIADGIISGIRKIKDQEYIQTTAPISPGSSGGALLDGFGNLLGITTFFIEGGQSVNFAIPVDAICVK